MWKDLKAAYRFPVLILGMLSLITGVLAGLGRLGLSVPEFSLNQAAYHGILMVPAFFGTVIGLERAVAIGQRWAYAAPLFTGLGGGALLIGLSPAIGIMLILAGNIIFLMASFKVLSLQYAIHNWILLIGAISLLTGNFLLLDSLSIHLALYWWMTFLLLTIAGERLELSRLVLRDTGRRRLLAWLSLVPVAGALLYTLLEIKAGVYVFSLGMACIAIWLVLFDIARRTVRMQGLTRFTAICMLAGYAWLLISAMLLSGHEFGIANFTRDAALHSFFLGFVFSMVLGHALIIFPAVTELDIPYSPAFYMAFILLQLSLLLRVIAGLANAPAVTSQAGLLNALALVLFIATLVWRIVLARYHAARMDKLHRLNP